MKSGIRAIALFGLTVSLFSGCGILGRRCNDCNGCNSTIGCRPCAIGWQRGGTDYGHHLRGNGACSTCGHHAYAQDPQTGSGVPAAATAYPYYTVRGLVISLQTTRQIWVGRTITEDADQSHGWLAKNWLAFGIDLSKQPHPRLSRRSSSEIIRKPLRESVSRACSVLSTMIATAGLPFG